MTSFTDFIDHVTTSGLAIAMLYIVWRQWQTNERRHQMETDRRIEQLTHAVSVMGSQINKLAAIVSRREQEVSDRH